MPDLDERVSQIEREAVGLEGRLASATQQLVGLANVPMQIVRMEGALSSLREALADMRREIGAIREEGANHAKEQSEERRALKIALLGLTGVILAAVIGGVFLLLAHKGG